MNRGGLLAEIGRRLVELKGSEAYWDPTERLDTLHEAQRRVNRLLRLMRDTKTANTVVGQQDYTLTTSFSIATGTFQGFVRPGLVYYDGVQDTVLRLRSLDWLYEQSPGWRAEGNGTPRIYFPSEGGLIVNDTLGLYPKPSAALTGGLRLHYLVRPADMTDDSHEPFNAAAATTKRFPSLESFHYALVWFTCGLLLQDDAPDKARVAMTQYALEVRSAKREVFAPEPFDHDAPGIHVTRGYRAGRTW